MQIDLHKCKHTRYTLPNTPPPWAHTDWEKHLPAAVDSNREDVVVEALFHHAVDLCVCGDLPALKTLQTKQRDGGNCEHLHGERQRFRARQKK